MNVIVLAAGFATRLYPLTRDRAKPLLDIAGRPVLDHILDRVFTIPDLDEVVVVSNGRFEAEFDEWIDAAERPVPLRHICDGAMTDTERLGALADLRLGLEKVSNPERDVVIVGGDNLIACDLGPFAERFRTHRHPLLLLREIPSPIPSARYSEVTADDWGRVRTFREKPTDPQSALSAICLYFFPPAIDSWLRDYLDEGGNADAPGYFFEWLTRSEVVDTAPITGSFFDIGNFETLEAARRAYASSDTPEISRS